MLLSLNALIQAFCGGIGHGRGGDFGGRHSRMTPAPGVQARPRPCCGVLGIWRLLFPPFAIVLPLLLLLLTSPARVANPACWARHPQHGRAVARPPLAQCPAQVRVAPRETAGRGATRRARPSRRPLSPPRNTQPSAVRLTAVSARRGLLVSACFSPVEHQVGAVSSPGELRRSRSTNLAFGAC